MSDIRATRSVLQVHLSHILLFTFAFAIVLAIPIAVAVSRGTHTGLKPPMAVFSMFDALAKAFAICGLFALVRHLFNGVKYSAHPAVRNACAGVRFGIRDSALVSFQWPFAGEPLR